MREWWFSRARYEKATMNAFFVEARAQWRHPRDWAEFPTNPTIPFLEHAFLAFGLFCAAPQSRDEFDYQEKRAKGGLIC